MPELKQNKRNAGFASIPNFPIALTRVFGWTIIGVLAAFLFNNFLTNWLGWPGVRLLANPSTGGHDPRIWLQVAIYAAAALAALSTSKSGGDSSSVLNTGSSGRAGCRRDQSRG